MSEQQQNRFLTILAEQLAEQKGMTITNLTIKEKNNYDVQTLYGSKNEQRL